MPATRAGPATSARPTAAAAPWRAATVDGEDIQKWLVANGWALAYARISRDYDADEKAAREAKAGMWQGAFIAPWDWRVRNKKTDYPRRRQAARERQRDPAGIGLRLGRAVARLHHQGQCQPFRRMHLSHADQPLVREDRDAVSKGTRWFCSVEDAEAAGCRETKR